MLISVLFFGRGANAVLATEALPAGEAQPAQEAWTPEEEKPTKPDPDDYNYQPPQEAKPAQEAQPATEATTINQDTSDQTSPQQTVNQLTSETEGIHSGTTSDGNIGTTTVETGDANNAGAVYNTANTNLAASGCCANDGGVTIANTDNGPSSSNGGSATIIDNDNTDQNNSANILNNLTQASVTGDNSASKNVGDSEIITGDANVSATIITAANTNVDGVAVSEFNIVDDHFGDYILDFNAGCISGCGGSADTSITNTGNGPYSDSSGTANIITNNDTTQNNDGTLENTINFLADSGHNETSRNTGGESSITTGDANVAANLLTFLNNNIAGGVVFGVVNIFGDLVGDIILPDDVFNKFACGTCGADTNIVNSGNGAGSDNNGLVNNETNNNVFQSNDATITNNLYLEAESGNNSASKNNQGDVNITTGESLVDASILNIANMNLLGGNMWLVIINEAGNWVGKLFGASSADFLAGSEGIEFAINPNGVIDVINSNNGPYSTNNGEVNSITNNNLTQTNNANVVNNLNLSANTGKNEADKNNGNVSISTGDAEAIANIVNFVNNNIAGGKLLVTFVNVFGSWAGDFLTPGSHKDESSVVAQGGLEQSNNSSSNSNSQTNQGGQTSNTGNSAVSSGPNLIAAAGFSGGSSGVSNTAGGSEVKIAGINNSDIHAGLTKGVTEDKKSARINLAWLLLSAPFLALGIIARKRIFRKPSLPAGRSD